MVTTAANVPANESPSPEPTSDFTVRFWGVRGSIPAPGPTTARYGGNTACVTIDGRYPDGTETIAILDAGTGIRQLSKELVSSGREILLLISHTQWDHIQGFPFFAPLWQPSRPIYLSRTERERGLFQTLLDQMDGQRFPLRLEDVEAHLLSFTPEEVAAREALGYQIQRIRLNHPGEAYGFRADLAGNRIAYLTDNELFPPEPGPTSFDEFVAFCQRADVLIHDAQYLESDLPQKHGWGHSVISQVRELAVAAKVKRLVLFHHDPDRSDAELDAIQADCDAWFAANAPEIVCTVAYEGLTIVLPEGSGANRP